MQCVEFVKDQQTREIFPDELDIGKRVANNADPRGLIVRPLINLNIMSPPLIMTREQVDFVVTTLLKAILETIDEPILSSSLILPGAEDEIFDAEDLFDAVHHDIDLFVDAGYCPLEPTTLLDLTEDVPKVLRMGQGVVDF